MRFGVVPNAVLDSNLRFFSGFWLGTNFAVLWLVPRIEKEGTLFRALWGMIFLGGLGRLASLEDAGAPPWPFYVVMALELLGAPVFVLWQRRNEREARIQTGGKGGHFDATARIIRGSCVDGSMCLSERLPLSWPARAARADRPRPVDQARPGSTRART